MQIELPYDPAIPLLGIHSEETRLEKEGNSYTCYNMSEPYGHYAKCNKPKTKQKNACIADMILKEPYG